MNPAVVSRAITAATALAEEFGLPVERAEILQNSNKLGLRLVPCDVFARVAVVGQEVGALEVELAQRLAAVGAPVAALEPRVPFDVHERAGFAVTFWAFLASTRRSLEPADYATALERLHAGMRHVDVATPHFTDRVAEAEHLVAERSLSPALADADRELLAATLQSSRRNIVERGAAEQLLHGEPHPGNVLPTSAGARFIDLETCCRGPVAFDLAHVPAEVATHYPDVDVDLLSECRLLVLAMVAAWRWDRADEYPDGRRFGERILALLRAGPPWPTLEQLSDGRS